MLISELEAQLKQLREMHGDKEIWCIDHKGDMFYKPFILYQSLEEWLAQPILGFTITSED